MATSISSARDARRRRILERGSDRLALITGRTQTLPPSTLPEPSPPDLSSDSPLLSSPDSYQAENRIPTSLSEKHASAAVLTHQSTLDPRSIAGSTLQTIEMNAEILRASSSEEEQEEPLLDGVAVRSPSSSMQKHLHIRSLFTLNKISSAVSSSEITRAWCSFAVAILVLLSYVGFPGLGSYIGRSLLLFRPLHLVLLTNATIVLARLLTASQSVVEGAECHTANVSSTGKDGLADQVGQVLKCGLAFQNIMSALLMDCSIYMIVVICGLAFTHGLGA